MPDSLRPDSFDDLLAAVERRKRRVLEHLLQERFQARFQPAHIREAVYSYIRRGGKSLRPAVAMLACGALGGDEERALPIAAAIEVFHTWTLVHDDVIDRDDTRRGLATVHREYADRAAAELGWDLKRAEHYGVSIALLAGDVQQAWSWSLIFDAHLEYGLPAEIALGLAQKLASEVTPLLVAGETLDVQYAGAALDLSEAQVMDMLWKKTGVLYEFAGFAGAAIAQNDAGGDNSMTAAIARFCSLCGTAFQIQDDILGVIGDAEQLGKPVGSDIREGKSTLLTLKALDLATGWQRARIVGALGKGAADAGEVAAVSRLFRELGVIEYARDISRRCVDDALLCLSEIPASRNRDLLEQWARYLVARDF